MGAGGGGLTVIVGRAAFLDGSELAGNVADANGDTFGDNHNALPGPAPVLMSAGVDLAGGAGSAGVARMQIEWDLSGLYGLQSALVTAQATLSTNKGTIDALDTYFYAGTGDQDGLLTDSDFEAPATQIAGVVMPVPADPVGTEGTFTFDVKSQLTQALSTDGIHFFSIQGRVDEGLVGTGAQRGLQVYTTADGNLPGHKQPVLKITTPGVSAAPLTFSILTLPSNGALQDSFNNPITSVPALLVSPQVRYTPATGFNGSDFFDFQVDDGLTVASARITLQVGSQTCVGGVDEDGRPCG